MFKKYLHKSTEPRKQFERNFSNNLFTILISVSSGETESINISSEDSSLEQTEDSKDETLKPKRNLKLAGKDNKTKPRDTKPTEAAESDKKGAVDTEPKDGKESDNTGSAENTKKIGKYDKTKSSGETRNLSRQRCKSAKSDTKLSSTPKNKVDRGKKYANVDDDPMLRDEKDLDGTIQESGKYIIRFPLFVLVLF